VRYPFLQPAMRLDREFFHEATSGVFGLASAA
jgi:hypothetical protein